MRAVGDKVAAAWSRWRLGRAVAIVAGPRHYRQHDEDVVLCTRCTRPGDITRGWLRRNRLTDRAWHLRCWPPHREPSRRARVQWLPYSYTGTWADLVQVLTRVSAR